MAAKSIEERLTAIESRLEELCAALPKSSSRGSHKPASTRASSQPKGGPSISQRLLARADAVPSEQRELAPSDLAEQHDHYVYGLPKK